ncbi:hypothetical protein Golob_017810 [Gossypium lobatum]|uniref:Uncharacterized protein n=1 Tax=Gossypium lobatum TaxID=34289 RepID=A0A7J8M8M0_9ROSI|nr:hypothetical protein [Gossypium lobatum]
MELPFSIPYHCSPIPLPLPHHPLDLCCQKVLFPNRMLRQQEPEEQSHHKRTR